MLQCELRQPLDMIGRQQVVIERILVPFPNQRILSESRIILDLAREVLENELLITSERPRRNLPVVQRRIAEMIIDFLQRKRSLPLQQVDDVQALLQFGHTPRSLVPTKIAKYSDIFRPTRELHETVKKTTFVKTRKP